MGVPRKIHQIWIHHDDVPLHKYPIKDIQSWKIHHPTWEYKLWCKEDCDTMIETSFPEVQEQYNAASYVVKSDICRVCVLILHGGIYADLDTMCLKSFDSLVDDIDVTIKNNSNSFFMAPKQAEYLKKFIEWVSQKRNVHQPLKFAGPLAILQFERTSGSFDDIMRNEGAYCEKNGFMHDGAYAVHKSIKNWSQPYLVVGSAPYVPEWLRKNRFQMSRHRLEICPVNNAWSLFAPHEISIWTYPCDLPQRGTIVPTKEQRDAIPDTREFMPKFYRRTYNGSTKRCEVTWKKSFTMMIDTVYMLIEKDDAKKIFVIGCDMVYTNTSRDYFYGDHPKCKGQADPLRKGQDVLIQALHELHEFAKSRGVQIWNLSEQQESLLPFRRTKLDSI